MGKGTVKRNKAYLGDVSSFYKVVREDLYDKEPFQQSPEKKVNE